MKMNKGTFITLIVSLLIGVIIGYSVAPKGGYIGGEYPEDSEWRFSSIRVVGSTTVLPIANACAIAFMSKYPTVSITVEGGGSGRGYKELIDGLCDIADASRKPKQEEIELAAQKGVKLTLHKIALDAVVVIVHKSVGRISLTLKQVGEIFTGKYSRWSELDSSLPDKPIVIFTREAGSGTRDTFEHFFMKPWNLEVSDSAHEVSSNAEMRESVRTTPYSIGYIGLGYLTEDVYPVNLASDENSPYVEPTRENIYSGKYPVVRYLYMVTNGWPKSGSLVDRFIDFVKSDEGQKIVEQCGFLALPGVEAGDAGDESGMISVQSSSHAPPVCAKNIERHEEFLEILLRGCDPQ